MKQEELKKAVDESKMPEERKLKPTTNIDKISDKESNDLQKYFNDKFNARD